MKWTNQTSGIGGGTAEGGTGARLPVTAPRKTLGGGASCRLAKPMRSEGVASPKDLGSGSRYFRPRCQTLKTILCLANVIHTHRGFPCGLFVFHLEVRRAKEGNAGWEQG